MKCRDVRRLFFLYVDSELDHRTAQEVNLHLESCAECRKRWSREMTIEEAAVRASRRAAGPVGDFPWHRVEEQVRDGPAHRAPEGRRRPAALGVLAVLVAAAVLSLVSWHALRPQPTVDRAVRSAADHHLKYLAGKSPSQVGSPEASAVREFYAGELGFDVLAPEGGDGGGFELLGARRCTFLGGPVAYLAYRIGERDVTVILGPSPAPEALHEAISQAPKGCVERQVGRYRTIISNVHGRLFVATGEASAESLCGLLRSFRECRREPGRDGSGEVPPPKAGT